MVGKVLGFVLDVPRKIIHTKATMVDKCNENEITDRREVPGLYPDSTSETGGWAFCRHCYDGAAQEFPGMIEKIAEVEVEKEKSPLPTYLQVEPKSETKRGPSRSKETPTS